MKRGETEMSHNLNIVNGKASMMYVGQAPWHGLGVRLPKLATSAEAIEAAGLNYHVDKKPMFTRGMGKCRVEVPDHFCTIRRDTGDILGVVGSRYTVLSNRDAFSFFDALVTEKEAIFETAGALGKGQVIWLLAKLPGYIRIGRHDEVKKYLLLTNSHDGSSMVRTKLSPIRVVCSNTLSSALEGAEQEVRIRHTASAVDRLQEAHKLLGLTHQLYQELEISFNRMLAKRITERQLIDYVKTLIPDNEEASFNTRTENMRSKILELSETGAGSEYSRGSLWGALNSVSEFTDHVQNSRDPMKRLNSVWFGSGERLKVRAFRLAESWLDN
jgi:phage/plasmid-like protein (TIGR03299 family)